MDWLLPGFVHHHPDTVKPKHVRHLVGINEQTGGTTRRNGTHKFGHGDHARLDMHVSVQQARNEITPVCFNNPCLFPNTMGGIFTNIGEMPVCDSKIGIRNHLSGLYADPTTLANDQISRLSPHGDINERS